MNIQAVYTKLNSRAKTSSVFCGIYAGIMWAVLVLASLALGFAGTLGGSFFGRLNNIDGSGVMAGYEALGNLLMSALMGVAMLAILAGIIMIAVPAVVFTIASAGGFSKAKKERIAIQTPGGVVDFRLFKKDAVFKLIISGLMIAFTLWSEVKNAVNMARNVLEYRSFNVFRHGFQITMTGLGLPLLILSPAIVVFVLSAMNLSDINKWNRWLAGIRAQNGQQNRRI